MADDKPKCRWCDQPATHYCDYFLPAGYPTRGHGTCSAPMCVAHKTNVGACFVDYRDEKGRRRGRLETTDYCPDHKDAGEEAS
jgi:hypothetical protein